MSNPQFQTVQVSTAQIFMRKQEIKSDFCHKTLILGKVCRILPEDNGVGARIVG
jgi:hypothetical protein